MLGLPLFCNNLMLVLDRRFVHRLRMVTGKDAIRSTRSSLQRVLERDLVQVPVGRIALTPGPEPVLSAAIATRPGGTTR
jgi:hypothetical protein